MKKETKKDLYKVELRIDKKIFKGEDEDLMTAIEKMGAVRLDVNYKGIFTISKGKKKIEKLMFNSLLRRFLSKPLARVVWVKMWKSVLDNE